MLQCASLVLQLLIKQYHIVTTQSNLGLADPQICFFGINSLNMSIMFRRFMVYQLISPAAHRDFIGLDDLFYILAILTYFGYF